MNLTLRRIRATIVAVEKHSVLHIVNVCVCVCVCVDLGIRHLVRICHLVICGMHRTFLHFIS